MARRIRYNRGSIESTGTAAKKLAERSNTTHYVFGTALGYTIDTAPAPFNRQCYQVSPDGSVEVIGKW